MTRAPERAAHDGAGRRSWNWHDAAPEVLLLVAAVALLALVVASWLGWLY